MKNIYLIIGIPGSGKSYWLKDKEEPNHAIFDDISQMSNPLELLKQSINSTKIKNIYISDVNFLELNVLKKAEETIKQYMGNQLFKINYVVFKSNKEISEHNVKLRNDGRKVDGTISRFYKKYEEILNYLENQSIELIETKKYIKNKKTLK